MSYTPKKAGPVFFSINQEPLLDASSRLRVKLEFDELSSKMTGTFKIDMDGITNVNSSGLALLIELKKTSIQKGINVEFINVHQPLLKTIAEAGLEEVLFCI